MSGFQVIRGSAEIPELEQRFEHAFGRRMNAEERKFFGLEDDELQSAESSQPQYMQSSKAA